MNSTHRHIFGQAPRTPSGFTCIGCDRPLIVGTLANHIRPDNGRPPAPVCPACSRQAAEDPRHRTVLERCAAAGMPFTQTQRLFASLGVFEVPTDAAGIAEALGVPVEVVREMGGCP